MITLLICLLKATIISSLLYFCFQAFLSDKLPARWARVYLLLSLLLPIVLPFIQLKINYVGELPLSTTSLKEVIVGKSTPTPQRVDLSNLFLGGYALISFTLLLASLAQYVSFYSFLRGRPFYYHNGYRVYKDTGRGPGSILKMIFIPANDIDDAILCHEAAHISNYHWADLLLTRVLQCIFWPNIYNHLILRELKLAHECEADAWAIKRSGVDTETYATLLLNSHFTTEQYSIAHSFTHHPLKRRITMLQKTTTRAGKITHLSLAIAIMCSCATISVLAQGTHNKAPHQGNAQKKIYEQVEEQPKFHGDLGGYLATNLHYPEKARAANKQGKSYINFVVNSDGSVSNVVVKRSSGNKLLDAEAVCAVQSMPAWDPGKVKGQPVACYFIIPIVFALED